jgi:solute carrier family 25 carnitine/acylcarnitine transporter 20/29
MAESNEIILPETLTEAITEKLHSFGELPQYRNSMIDYVSGTVGGAVVVLVGHPFDTTKTRMQTAPTGYYRSTMDCVQKTCNVQGLKGLYTGIGAPLVGQMIFRACAFTTFFQASRIINSIDEEKGIEGDEHDFSATKTMIAGAATGLAISFIESPIDLVKTKLQVQIFNLQQDSRFKPKFHTVRTCISFLLRQHGVTSLWQGLPSTIIRNVPANAMFFPVNEIVKHEIAKREGINVSELTVPQRLVAGASAGLCYWVGTYPLDVIKARNQAMKYAERQGWAATARSIYSEFGLRGFARGLAPCALRAIPACSIMFTTVDCVRETLQKNI